MFHKIFLLTDDQIKDIFDNCRNLGICGAIFAAADWEIAHIIPMDSIISVRISAIVTACFRFSVTGKVLAFEGSFIVV